MVEPKFHFICPALGVQSLRNRSFSDTGNVLTALKVLWVTESSGFISSTIYPIVPSLDLRLLHALG